ncbi:hypothetical protein [Clostridium botulinum]|uniref:Membrane protein n=1 Tax=Clostridium botulinum TaxID=1491 RepID=A0A9Q1UZG2_CLOBO|nr:hypothetical protein [Clostridium botulinum]AEB75264.1 hypothetical protein CbC4_0584 [Clostridium botulinum BKT015925]KEI03250.1 membrane protein [Clostridium botulinum C/D str. Sp77]KEI03279.1 membrane protein [Clostridium botulinum D str. 16868]KLU76482.1 membrane protein [Clostridium botulinum V891]KOA79057.1 membrane protein [Clostridium botulinum]
MMNVIKTAIITIVISIISGLLLEYFKNVAPRILCSIGKGIAMEINNKKVYAYSINVSNLSKKIIHDLTLNIQSPQSNLKIADAKITKGLKFDSLIKDDNVVIDIPFLSKGDKFSVTVYVENKHGLRNKPIIVMRSPENFKQVDSTEKTEKLSLLNTNKNHENKKPSKNKRVMISIATIILFVSVGILLKFCFEGLTTNTKSPSVKPEVNEKSNDETRVLENEKNKNIDIKTPTRRKNRNNDINTNTLKEETIKNTDAHTSKGEIIKNKDTKAPTGKKEENTDIKPTSGETTGNKDEGSKNTDAKKSKPKEGTTENTNEKTSTDGTTGNGGN